MLETMKIKNIYFSMNDASKSERQPWIRRVIFSDHDKKKLEGLESETNQASLYWKASCYLI